jgi:hypothetical protein
MQAFCLMHYAAIYCSFVNLETELGLGVGDQCKLQAAQCINSCSSIVATYARQNA